MCRVKLAFNKGYVMMVPSSLCLLFLRYFLISTIYLIMAYTSIILIYQFNFLQNEMPFWAKSYEHFYSYKLRLKH